MRKETKRCYLCGKFTKTTIIASSIKTGTIKEFCTTCTILPLKFSNGYIAPFSDFWKKED